MTLRLPMDAADLAAAAYGRKLPRFRPIPETYGLALMLLVLRNVERKQAIWLVDPAVHDALCDPAEQFAQALTGRPSPEGWRGGALAGLRSMAGDALHEDLAPWPYNPPDRDDVPVKRLWVDDPADWDWSEDPARCRQGPFRARLVSDLAGRPGISEAWDAMITEWTRQPTWDEDRRGRYIHRSMLCAWSSSFERPSETRRLRAEVTGVNPAGEVPSGQG